MDAFIEKASELLVSQGAWGLLVAVLAYLAYTRDKEVDKLNERLIGSAEARVSELKLCIESSNTNTAAVREVKAEVAVLVAQGRGGRHS